MTDAQELVHRGVHPQRLLGAQREVLSYLDFCAKHALTSAAPDAVTLYLATTEDSGTQARSRLARLDLWAQLHGQPPPGRTVQVRTFMRGYFGQHPLGPRLDRAEPLYGADIRALIDAAVAPTWQQIRDATFLVVMNSSGLRQTEMRRLRWQNIRFRSNCVVVETVLRKSRRSPIRAAVELPAGDSPDLCPVWWLTRLRQATPLGDRSTFATRGARVATTRLTAYGHEIDRRRSGRQRLGEATLGVEEMTELVHRATAPLPIGLRDRAAVLFGYLGGLTNREASALRVRDVRTAEAGLVLHVLGRPWPDVGLPRQAVRQYCPVEAWNDWHQILRDTGHAAPDDPVIVGCDRYVANLSHAPLSTDNLARLVASRAEQAGLIGQFAYTSLRNGFVRTTTVAGVPHQEVAAHIGHRTLDGVAQRHRDEALMDSSLLRRIGI